MINQPINQVRLTNVAYVRLNKKGKRFEIACYRNKVVNWRNKIETDIDEVLQVASVFTNVSKGNLASSKDLMEVFGTADTKTICAEILDKGDLQVSEQERQALLDSMFRDVAAIASDLSINPENGRSYSLAMIQEGMKQVHFSVSLTKSAKQQALEVIRKLKSVMAIARAAMHLKLVCRDTDVPAVMAMLDTESRSVALIHPAGTNGTATTTTGSGSETTLSGQAQDGAVAPAPSSSSTSTSEPVLTASVEVRADPEAYRRIEDGVRAITQGVGRVEVIHMRVAAPSAFGTSATNTGAGAGEDEGHGSEDGSEGEEEQQEEVVNTSGKAKKGGKKGNASSSSSVSAGATSSASGASRREERLADKGVKHLMGMLDGVKLAAAEDEDENEEESEEEDEVTSNKKASARRKDQKKKDKRAAPKSTPPQSQQQQALVGGNEYKPSLPEPPTTTSTNTTTADATTTAVAPPAPLPPGAKSCNTCGGVFAGDAEYRVHFKSDWHRHNLKRKMKTLTAISEGAFAALTDAEKRAFDDYNKETL